MTRPAAPMLASERPLRPADPALAVGPDQRGTRERRARVEALSIVLLMALFTCAYALSGMLRHWHFGTSAFDLGIFDQVVWHLSRLETPKSTINGFGNIFGDHFHPLIAVLAPLYWIVPAAETLIIAQALLFAMSIVPVFLYVRSRLTFGLTMALCVAYGLFWGLQRAAAFDFHEVAFAPLFIATAILAMDRRRWGLFWPTVVGIGLIKEDLLPVLVFLGLYLLATGEYRRGALLAVASVAAFVVVVRLVIPSLNDANGYTYASAFSQILQQPWMVPVTLVTPAAVKLQTAVLWVLPFALLPLASPMSILLVPFVLTRFLSDAPNHWGTMFHYSAPLAPILAMSAGDGLARLASTTRLLLTRRRMIGLVTATVVLSAILPGGQPLWGLFLPKNYRATTFERTGYRALELIPNNASVVAQAAVVPHLSQRNFVYMLDTHAPDADYVIVGSELNPWPGAAFADLEALLGERRLEGYTDVFNENGWTILRAPARRPIEP